MPKIAADRCLTSRPTISWRLLPVFLLLAIAAPLFAQPYPACSVRAYGAKGDGATLDTRFGVLDRISDDFRGQ